MAWALAVAVIAMVVGVVWIVASARNRSDRMHADTVGKLIDKLGASQEAMAYLESASGQKLLDSVTSRRTNPYRRILLAMGVGAVLCSWGVGCLVFSVAADGWTYAETLGQGIILISLGVGFLLAAGGSYKLSKAWGLLDDPQRS